MTWTLAKAKDQLSELVRRAMDDGPQVISVRGRDTAVVLSKDDFDRLRESGSASTFKDVVAEFDFEDLDLTRDPTPARDVDL